MAIQSIQSIQKVGKVYCATFQKVMNNYFFYVVT